MVILALKLAAVLIFSSWLHSFLLDVFLWRHTWHFPVLPKGARNRKRHTWKKVKNTWCSEINQVPLFIIIIINDSVTILQYRAFNDKTWIITFNISVAVWNYGLNKRASIERIKKRGIESQKIKKEETVNWIKRIMYIKCLLMWKWEREKYIGKEKYF